MAGVLQFKISVFIKGQEILPEMAGRLRDFRPVFDVIIRKWAQTNKDKFGMGAGKEMSGTEVDPEVFWLGLRPATMRAKRAKGQEDALLVATGDLRASLTDPERFFQAVTERDAAFGTPTSPEDAQKISGNWRRRQAIFLSVDDQRMIEKQVTDYLNLGPDWEQLRFAQGLSASGRRSEEAQLDVDFNDAMATLDA